MKRWIFALAAGLLFCTAAGAACSRLVPLETVEVTGVSIPASGNTLVFSENVACLNSVYVHCDVTGANLDAFLIKGGASGATDTFFSTSLDFTSPVGVLRWTSGDLTAVTSGNPASFILDVAGFKTIYVYASAASGTASLTCVASGS